jgi:hypothetical protein
VTPPRIFGIPAADAPVIAVLRRGPSDWFHVGRWDIEHAAYEPGAWVRGTIYPQRCDLSPDGRFLCYFMLIGGADWSAGTTFIAISKLPWVHALAAWGTAGTWTRGAHFVDSGAAAVEAPDEGVIDATQLRYGLATTIPATFAVERRRGWEETTDTPARSDDDLWDERRADRVTMRKPRPGRADAPPVELRVRGRYAAFRQGPIGNEPVETQYALARGADESPLGDVHWAEWDAQGRLLVATKSGLLQVRDVDRDDGAGRDEIDLSAATPDPQHAPPDARGW